MMSVLASRQRSRSRVSENPRPSRNCAQRTHRSAGRLGLARAQALHGDTAKAKAAYQYFLTLWKDADPDIPILIAAKVEYAKLQ
jgi:hypothetical protein